MRGFLKNVFNLVIVVLLLNVKNNEIARHAVLVQQDDTIRMRNITVSRNTFTCETFRDCARDSLRARHRYRRDDDLALVDLSMVQYSIGRSSWITHICGVRAVCFAEIFINKAMVCGKSVVCVCMCVPILPLVFIIAPTIGEVCYGSRGNALIN